MRKRVVATLALTALVVGCCQGEAGADPVLVFAAASLRDVAEDLAADFAERHGERVAFNFAGSNTLAQQIRAAPRADVFLSADESWIRFLESAGDALAAPPRAFLGNGLVAIRHRDSALRLDGPQGLVAAPFRHLALADPATVPAGRYAKAHLERAAPGVWRAVADRAVPTLDVRAALALVESDPEILGVVYRSDALSSDKVRVLFDFPPLDDVPILYWAAAIRGGGNPDAGRLFVDYLGRREAQEIARRHGFSAATS